MHLYARASCGSFLCIALASILPFSALAFPAPAQPHSGSPDTTWSAYGGDSAGTRFSTATQVTASNVAQLRPAWSFSTGALDSIPPDFRKDVSFESTPVLLGSAVLLTSPLDSVFALDAVSGQLRWRFDPGVRITHPGMLLTSRGLALWPTGASAPDFTHFCATRVFIGTLDGRLISLDAATGRPCTGFGNAGAVDLTSGTHFASIGGYGLTSAPTVIGDVVVVGSTVADDQQVDVESGVVRGYDARSGRLLWSWEPLAWAQSQRLRTGAGNAWSTLSADPVLGLVYVPTGSPSPDFFGGLRPGDNRDANSVVALDARTGRKVWAFQFVHHDLWDYDIAAQPLLFNFRGVTPAVAVATKFGEVFVLDRRDGKPLIPIDERPVTTSHVSGEWTSPTQPESSLPPLTSLAPFMESPQAGIRSSADFETCRAQLARLASSGPFTPPAVRPTLEYPGNLGGVNWGSLALAPSTATLFANVNSLPVEIRLLPRSSPYVLWHVFAEPTVRDFPFWLYFGGGLYVLFCLDRRSFWVGWVRFSISLAVAAGSAAVTLFPMVPDYAHFGTELSPQRGTPFYIYRRPVMDAHGQPCVAPPWGALTALDLSSGRILWRAPLGTAVAGRQTGAVSLGGPIVTASGLVFDAATSDRRLRAFDAPSGQELWSATLPGPAFATPMTYILGGRQFVVISTGPHSGLGVLPRDAVVAFALPPSGHPAASTSTPVSTSPLRKIVPWTSSSSAAATRSLAQ